MRIFGGERVQNLMKHPGLEEDVPIENKMITSTIEGAQKSWKPATSASGKTCCSLTT